MRNFSHWTPVAFSFILCYSALLIILMQLGTGRGASWAWQIPFFGHLPVCFVLVACGTSQMQREIVELRKQLLELQQKSVD